MHINGYNNKIEFHTNIILNEDESLKAIKDWKGLLSAIIQHVPEEADTLKPIIQFLSFGSRTYQNLHARS